MAELEKQREEFEAERKAFAGEKEAMMVEIEDKEKAVEEGLAALEAEKEAMKSRDTTGTDIIKVNVSGTHMDVLRSTLCLIEGSMLAIQFSGRWEDSMKKDEDGRIFLNYDPDSFKLILKELWECEMDPESRT